MIHVSLGLDDPITTYAYGPPPSELELRCRRYRSTVFGGPVFAEINATGPEHVLWGTLEWLRRPVTLRNGAGQPVWWGYIQEIEVQIGKHTVGVSLDKMANRVRIAYVQRAADTGLKRETSTAVEDAASIARYGTKEVLYSLGDATPARAQAKGDELLADGRQPRAIQTFSGDAGDLTATLYCRGWVETLGWRHYERTGTRMVLEGETGGALQAIGWQLVSSDIFFTRNAGAIHDFQARLGALAAKNKIFVTGSTTNSREYTVERPTRDKRVAYAATTILFGATDDIYDSADGFGFIRNNALIRISGSGQNDGIYEIDGVVDAGYVTTSGNSIIAEGPPGTVTIEQGHEVGVKPVPAFNIESGSKTITLYGYRMAQSFVAAFAGSIGQIGIVAGKSGAPTDSLRLSLCANNAGAPGTVLSSVEVLGSNLLLGAEWTWFEFTDRPTVTSGATYWLLVERTGANSATDHFNVATITVDAGAGGTCLAYTGTVWVANPTDTRLAYQIWQVEETTEQIRQIAVSAVGQFISAVTIENASGIWDNAERDGDKTGSDEIGKLLDAGQASGNRLLLTIDQNRALRVYAKPTKPAEGDAPDVYTMNGRVMTAGGMQRRAEGSLPVGEWLAIERTPRHLGLSPVFVDAAEYDADRGTITITPEGSK